MVATPVDVFEYLIDFRDLKVIFYHLRSGKKIHVAFLTDKHGEHNKYILDATNKEFCDLLRKIAREDFGILLTKPSIKLLVEHMESIAIEGENPYKN